MKYTVIVRRVEYSSFRIEVEAEGIQEAEELALNMATDDEFDECKNDTEYEAEVDQTDEDIVEKIYLK